MSNLFSTGAHINYEVSQSLEHFYSFCDYVIMLQDCDVIIKQKVLKDIEKSHSL